MVLLKIVTSLALTFNVIATAFSPNAVHHRELINADTSTTVVVTVTTVPTAPPDVVVTRTYTQSVYTSRTIVPIWSNCTTQVYVSTSPSSTAVIPTPTSPTISVIRPTTQGANDAVAVAARQASGSATTITTTVTAASRPARTTTSYVIETATQTAPQTFSAYQCVATIAYLYTTDVSTTISYTQTSYSTTITATSRITCGVFGLAGDAAPETRLPQTALSTEVAQPATLMERQVVPTSSAPAPSLTPQGVIDTTTVHLTRTVYSVVHLNATGPSIRLTYECSPTVYDTVTAPRTQTAWLSTATVVSSVNCGPRGAAASEVRRAATSSASVGAPGPTDTAIHRTRTVYPTVTVTETTPTTRTIINCATSVSASASTTASAPGPTPS